MTHPSGYQAFGDYLLLGEIASGGMGVVHQAVHSRLNRACALKLIRTGTIANAVERARFVAEAEAAAALDHPAIVRVRQAGEVDGQLFLEMELVEGGTLADLLATGPLEPRAAAQLVATLAAAIQHAHDRGVLHRDLKPGNVLLDAEGHPHLADFGLARLLHRDSDLTRTQAVLGTPAYLPPEIASGQSRSATTAVDVYGLGAILYQCLTGRPPYEAPTPLAVLHAVQQGPPPAPGRIRPGIPRDLEILVLRAMTRDVSGRLPSAGEFSAELGRWLNGEPIRSRPIPYWEQVLAWSRRHPALAGMSAALILVIAIAFVVTDQQRRAARNLSRSLLRQLTITSAAQATSHFTSGREHRGLAAFAAILRRDPTNLAVATQLAMGLMDFSWPHPACELGTAGTEVRAIAQSPDGLALVTASANGKVQSWNSRDGRPMGLLREHPEQNWKRLTFDNAGKWLLSLGEEGSLRVWPALGESAAVSMGPPLTRVLGGSFRPGQSTLAVAQDGLPVQLIEPDRARSPVSLPAESLGTTILSFDSTGRVLAMAGSAPTVRLWHLDRQRWLAPIPLPAPARGIAYGDAGRMLAVTTVSNEVILFRMPDGEQLARLPHKSPEPARFNPGGQFLFYSPLMRSMAVIRPPSLTPHSFPSRSGLPYWGLVFSRDGNRVLAEGAQRGVQPFIHRPGRGFGTLGELVPHSWEVESAMFLRDPDRLVVAGGTNAAVVWEINRRHPSPRLHELVAGLVAAGFSSDSRTLRTIHPDGALREFHPPRDYAGDRKPFVPHPVTEAAFAPGAAIAAIAREKVASLWQVEPPRELVQLPPASADISLMAFSPDGRTLAVGTLDAQLLLWDVAGQRLRAPPLNLCPTNPPNFFAARFQSLDFSADSKWLGVAGQSSLAHVIDVGSGAVLATLEHGAPVTRTLVLADGKRVATASFSAEARLWEIPGGRPIGKPFIHAGIVHDIDLSPDNRWLATASDDRSVRIWDVEAGRQVSEVTSSYSHLKSRFFANGRSLLSTLKENLVTFQDAETGQPLARRRGLGFPANRIVISPDGRWAALYEHRRKGMLTSIATPDTPAPPWLPQLAEALAGERHFPDGSVERVPPGEYLRLRAELSKLRGDDFWLGHLLPGMLGDDIDYTPVTTEQEPAEDEEP